MLNKNETALLILKQSTRQISVTGKCWQKDLRLKSISILLRAQWMQRLFHHLCQDKEKS